MAEFLYEALDKSGKQIKGIVESGNEDRILEKLRDMGYYPMSVRAHRRRSAAAGDLLALPGLKHIFSRITPKHLTSFSRQLATLIDAGLPILRSLAILREQAESAVFKDVIARMSRDIESGASFSEALSKHPRVFDRLYVNMVRAGELGGVLEKVLNKIAGYLEKRRTLIGKVKSALTYPAAVLGIASIIVSFILIVILPKFADIYTQLGAELPAPTRLLMHASNALVHQFWIPLAAGIVLVAVLKQLKANRRTKYYLDLCLLKLPVFGPIFQKVAIVRFAGTLATLIDSGVPILQALDIVRDSSGNEVLARAMAMVRRSVEDGETMHEPLMRCVAIFPPLVVHMVAVGEETGAVDLMLRKVGEAYEHEVDDTVNALTSILEPVLIVILGVVIGGIVIALYMPLFNLVQHV